MSAAAELIQAWLTGPMPLQRQHLVLLLSLYNRIILGYVQSATLRGQACKVRMISSLMDYLARPAEQVGKPGKVVLEKEDD